MLLDIFDPKAKPRAIGIDLGTTNSIVAVAADGPPRALISCDGSPLLPSVVHFGDHGLVIVGRAARERFKEDPRRTIVSSKRLIGRSHAEVRAELPDASVLSDGASAEPPRLFLGGKWISPVEVSAEILKSLRQSAISQLTQIGGAVITVPAYFDDAQRQATRDAGRIAGLEVLRLLNEPTAAALAYGLEGRRNGKFLVYDLGGGTFDVTVLTLDEGVFQVLSTGGDSRLGGDDFDRLIAERIYGEIRGAEVSSPLPRIPEVWALSLVKARELKHALSGAVEAEVELPGRGGVDLRFRMARAELAQLSRELVERTMLAAERALRDAGTTKENLDGVILVGGSTKMPLIRERVEAWFGRPALCEIDPELVVAYGAALQAASLSGEGEDVLLLDVLPLSLGVETMGGAVDKILPRNTTIPVGARSTFTTYADNQTGFEIHVVQGEREMAADCRSLARFSLSGIPPMPAGLARLEVEFHVDENNLLTVTAQETSTGKRQEVKVKPSYGLSDDDIEDMLIAALEHGEVDLLRRRIAEARTEASRMLLATKKALLADGDLLSSEEKEAVLAASRDLEDAVERAASESSMVRPERLQILIDRLDEVTHGWAGRRMDRAFSTALSGRELDLLGRDVENAKGVDEHVRLHQENRGSARR